MGKQNLNVPENGVDELNDSLVSMSEKVQDNKKIILWAACAVVAVAVLVLGYIYLVRQPGQAKANDNIGEADIQMILGNDSIALAEYMSVADNDGYDAANRAALQAAIMLYQKGDYEKALNYVDKFDAAKNNYWDGGEWADCKGKLQSAVTNGSGEAYVFSMRTTDESGKSLVPASYEKPSWFDGISDIWVTSVVEFDGAKDLTKGTVEFDVKFDNMAKGVMIFGQSGENKTFSGLVCTDKKNFNGNTDSWDSFVNITELENGWYRYEFDFAKYAVLNDSTGDKANVLEECEMLGLTFLNGSKNYNSNLCKGIDFTKESVVYVDNMVILDKDEIDLAGNLTAVHGKTEMVDGGNGSKKTFKYTGSTEKNWEEISLAIDETDMTGKKVVFDVKFENISQGFDVKIGAVHTTYCFTDGNNLNGGADSDLAAYKVTNLGNGWFRYEVDASKLLESSGTGDITSVTSITLLLAVGNVDGWKNELNKVDAAKANVLYIDNFKIV